MTTIMKCTTCGMPDLEGPLGNDDDGNLVCQSCYTKPKTDGTVCDFCMEPDPGWAYNCSPFTVVLPADQRGEMVAIDMDEIWLACDACRTLVDADDRETLTLRVITLRGYPEHMSSEEARDFRSAIDTYFEVVLSMVSKPPNEVK